MTNPYSSPFSDTECNVEPVANSTGLYLAAIAASGFICWLLFIGGLANAFKDMFGGPAPPGTWIYFAVSGCFGLAAQIVGGLVFMKRKELKVGWGTLFGVVLMMLFSALPLYGMAEGILQSIVRG